MELVTQVADNVFYNPAYKVVTIDGIPALEVPQCPGYYLTQEGKLWNPIKKDYRAPYFDTRREILIVEVVINGKKKFLKAGHLLADCFLPLDENKPVVDYLDDNPKNIALHNLYWRRRLSRFGKGVVPMYETRAGIAERKEMSRLAREAKASVTPKIVFQVPSGNEDLIKDLKVYYPKLLSNYSIVDKATLELLREKTWETIAVMKTFRYEHATARMRLYKGAYRRSREFGIEINLCAEDIYLPFNCPYMGIPIEYGNTIPTRYSASLDKIDPSKGYVVGNVQVITSLANQMKTNATIEEILIFSKNALKIYG